MTQIKYAIAHLQKASNTARPENVPGSQCSAHGKKHYYFCKIKQF